MTNELQHHGILGMKWGVRRTPEELGHDTGGKSDGAKGNGSKQANRHGGAKNQTETSRWDSNERLKRSIERLELEKKYRDLLNEKKRQGTGDIKKALTNALNDFGVGALRKLVQKGLDKMFDKNDFDIDEWRDADVNTMDDKTIKKVKNWYENAKQIENMRKQVNPRKSDDKDDSSKANDKKLPWAYRKSGSIDREKISAFVKPESTRSVKLTEEERKRRMARSDEGLAFVPRKRTKAEKTIDRLPSGRQREIERIFLNIGQ